MVATGIIIAGILVVLLIALTYMLTPSIKRRDETFGMCESYYAHRGLHDNDSSAPENSLFAFKLAIEYKVGIELDVQRTRDNELIVMHDENLIRATGMDRLVEDVAYEDIKDLTLFESQEKIPTFEETLKLVDGQVPLIIEIKNDKDISMTCQKVCKVLDSYKGSYCIESFNPLILKWFRKNRPDVIRGQLSSDFIKENATDSFWGNFAMSNLLVNCVSKPDFIAYNLKYRKKFCLKAMKSLYDVPCFAWTVKSEDTMAQIADTFEGYIFEGFLPEKKKIL